MNEELIGSAVTFLHDPSVAQSPLAKRVEFLESKGLTQHEIEEALKRAEAGTGGSASASAPSAATTPAAPLHSSYGPPAALPPLDYYNPPAPPQRSWKDYFIMATATAGVSYGLYQVVTKYLIPSIIPPSQSQVERDQQKIDEEFMKIDKLLEQLASDQSQMKEANDLRLQEVDSVVSNVNDFLSKYNKDKLAFDDDLRLMKLEIDNLRNSVEKNMNNTRENVKDELHEISEELASLRSLIVARSEGKGEHERKLAPVSSIPSASEILRRARANAPQAPADSAAASAPASAPATATAPTSAASAPTPAAGYTAPTQVGNVFAAGIPEWQLKKKQEEEESERSKEEEKESPKEQTAPAAPQPEDAPVGFSKPNGTDSEVAKAIANVGVPAWQLNA
ncbi:Peroxisomal membrane protein PEX14 [[Candida] zeylanoides]